MLAIRRTRSIDGFDGLKLISVAKTSMHFHVGELFIEEHVTGRGHQRVKYTLWCISPNRRSRQGRGHVERHIPFCRSS